MKRLSLILAMVIGCGALAAGADAGADDCKSDSLAARGFGRVYIALRQGADGSGKSFADARDGSTVEKFDHILRCYAEGCTDSRPPHPNVAKTENLIVCLGPGTYQTRGTYDFLINVPHKTEKGFTLGKAWKLHGAGKDKTTVQLAEYLPIRAEPNPGSMPLNTGVGIVFSTYSDDASNIEISDLTVDGNYPVLKQRASREGIKALNLRAIELRSDTGKSWIHDVHVINAAGEIGAMDIKYESFPVWIYSVRPDSAPTDSSGNIIERITMSNYGGGKCTAIAIANAAGEVRNNRVEGYQIGYGGWSMGPVWFHDNVAVDTEYGFNIDSLINKGVRIERNQIVHPRAYGFVIGGGGTYDEFMIRDNTVQINRPGVIALVLQGNVRNALVAENSFLAEDLPMRASAIRSFNHGRTGPNRNNTYQGNRISEKLRITFSDRPGKQDNCMAGNRDERGRPLPDMPDNHAEPCRLITATPP